MDIKKLLNKHQIIDCDFKNLDNLDFCGVYIIYNPKEKDEVVYVGSAYARPIRDRLKQYIKANDTGNSLMHAICKKDFDVSKVRDITADQKERAVKKILEFNIKAIRHNDLEYQLIHDSSPKYNTAGTQIDTTEW